jgi:GMP synthase-like glutamine amidotransferase
VNDFVMLQYGAADGPGLLGAVLAERKRQVLVVRRDRGDTPDVDVAHARALVVLAAPATVQMDTGWDLKTITAFQEAEVPVIGISEGALLVAQALGGAVTASPPAEPFVSMRRTAAAEGDPMCKGLVEGSRWFVTAPLLSDLPDGAEALAVDSDGEVGMFRAAASVYGVRVRAELEGREVLARLDQPTVDGEEAIQGAAAAAWRDDAVGLQPFLTAHGASLLGRWVDQVVGRTDDEQPWGRRGPKPVPRPGLSLNPA